MLGSDSMKAVPEILMRSGPWEETHCRNMPTGRLLTGLKGLELMDTGRCQSFCHFVRVGRSFPEAGHRCLHPRR